MRARINDFKCYGLSFLFREAEETIPSFCGVKLKIISVVGARPQFVKAAIISRALRTLPAVEEIIVHTDQHYDADMSQVFFDELEIPVPKHHLHIGSAKHGSQTGRMLESLENVFELENPDWVLLLGDTNSTIAGALAAAKLHMPVAHVEAGLRSFNRRMPEEINRVLTDHASDLLFAPTPLAVTNLLHEGIDGGRVRLVGDVMYDAALYYGSRAERKSNVLERLKWGKKSYVLATIHRPENTDSPKKLRSILLGLSSVAMQLPVIFPIHPRTRNAILSDVDLVEAAKGIRFIDPIGYLDMTMLERNARLIATDSGGIQKEAFFFAVPCVTLRTETEWHELVDMGWNRLTPPDSPDVVSSAILDGLLKEPEETANPYGDGHASEQIVQILTDWDRVSARQNFSSNLISQARAI
jgi:UDP-GlcNAc3NAcA epimerase